MNVQGNTDLKAGAITSTQKAIDDNKNSFQTAKLTTSDLQNSASFSAESYQVTVGTNGGSAGAGQDSGSASSTTKAAISGIAGNQSARTGDAETGMVVTGSAACAETLGAGCAVAGAGYAGLMWSVDQMKAGGTTVINGQAMPTMGGQLASNLFGVSPETGELLNSLVGLSPLAIDAALTNRAINVQAAANAWAKGTYTGQSAVTYQGRVYRFSDPQYADKTWDIYPGNVSSNFRYSEPGVGSIYSGTAVQTSAAEVRSYPQGAFQPKTLVAGDVRLDGVLDLTDPAALKALGVTRADLTKAGHGANGAYTQTQRIAEWAREQGYNGILAPSAQSRTGTNLITFDNTKVTNVKASPLPTSVTPPAWK